VQRLLRAPGIGLASFPRADALIALVSVLNKRVLPAGVVDLVHNVPPTDVVLVATRASLAVRRAWRSSRSRGLRRIGGPSVDQLARRFANNALTAGTSFTGTFMTVVVVDRYAASSSATASESD
jgi:hypothetical protein